MLKASHSKLVAFGFIILVSFTILLTTSGQASASYTSAEIQGRKLWRTGLSIAVTMFAIVGISYAVIDLGLKHPGFWPALLVSGILVLIGLYSSGFDQEKINFWMATIVGLSLVAITINSAIVAYVTRKL